MANWMFTPQMLSREVLTWLPTGSEVIAWEEAHGDILVQWGPNSFIQVDKLHRILSMDDFAARYKPLVDAKLIETWTLVEYPSPKADQWSAEEMATGLGGKPYSFNRLLSIEEMRERYPVPKPKA